MDSLVSSGKITYAKLGRGLLAVASLGVEESKSSLPKTFNLTPTLITKISVSTIPDHFHRSKETSEKMDGRLLPRKLVTKRCLLVRVLLVAALEMGAVRRDD